VESLPFVLIYIVTIKSIYYSGYPDLNDTYPSIVLVILVKYEWRRGGYFSGDKGFTLDLRSSRVRNGARGTREASPDIKELSCTPDVLPLWLKKDFLTTQIHASWSASFVPPFRVPLINCTWESIPWHTELAKVYPGPTFQKISS